jgi:hypothetical protein
VKNSVELIGRKVDLKELHINYFKCSVRAKNFTMYEKNQSDKFVSFQELYVNFDPWNLFKNEIAFSEIRLDKPWVSLVYADSAFNFSDFMQTGDTTMADTTDEMESDTLKFLVKNFSINSGYIKYEDKSSNTNTELKDLSVKVPEISWNSKQSKMGVEFILGKDGEVAVDGMINQASGEYSVILKTNNIDITPFAGYAKAFIAADITSGKLYSNLRVKGEMNNPLNMKVFGEAGLKDIAIFEEDGKKFCSFKDIYVRMDSLDIGSSNFCIDKVLIDEPQIVAVLEKNNTNIQRILAPILNDTSAVADTTNDTTVVHYSIDTLVLRGGYIDFSDLSLNRPFKFDIKNLSLDVAGFSDLAAKIPLNFSMNLNGPGTFNGKATLSMVNMTDVVFEGNIAKLDMVSLSPYSEYYLARPIKKGSFNYDCRLKMTPSMLDNNNKLKIANLEFGKKTKDTTAYKVPVILALYIIKDREGLIKIDLPVTGSPSDPKFKLRKIIWKTLEEFLLKAISEPFEAIGKMFGTSPESIKQIPFDFLQDSLTAEQRSKLDKISEIVVKKPELNFTFIQTTDPEKEKALIAVQQAKTLFISKATAQGTEPEEIRRKAAAVSNFDPAFLTFLGIEGESNEGSLAERCLQLVGSENVETEFTQLMLKRENILKTFFADKALPAGSVGFKTTDLRNLPVEMKTPKFIIELNVK